MLKYSVFFSEAYAEIQLFNFQLSSACFWKRGKLVLQYIVEMEEGSNCFPAD